MRLHRARGTGAVQQGVSRRSKKAHIARHPSAVPQQRPGQGDVRDDVRGYSRRFRAQTTPRGALRTHVRGGAHAGLTHRHRRRVGG